MVDPLPDRAGKGRGAVSNRTGRFETEVRQRVDDGWRYAGMEDDNAPSPRTRLHRDSAKSILSRNDSPDIPFDRSINPYRGCEHGCVYCFARPTHAYLGLSPGLDFETEIYQKPDAPDLLEATFRRPGYRPAVIALGANTDPYQPVERNTRLTRRILEVLWGFRHPVGIVTKSALVLRDLDLLKRMADRNLAYVCISITTLDRDLARRMEPRAPTPQRRLDAIGALSRAGVPVAVLSSPMIPALNDHEMDAILQAAAQAGAVCAGYTLLRLPLEIGGLFAEWLQEHRPDRASRVLNQIRAMRGGALYRAEFGSRMRGQGATADLLSRRFAAACRRYGLDGARFQLDTGQFSAPPPRVDTLPLFRGLPNE